MKSYVEIIFVITPNYKKLKKVIGHLTKNPPINIAKDIRNKGNPKMDITNQTNKIGINRIQNINGIKGIIISNPYQF